MQALVLLDDAARRSALAAELARRGFDVACATDAPAARQHARAARLDVLVLDEAPGGRLAHDVVLLAEWRNPCLAAVVVSDRGAAAVDELFALIPAVRAVAPPESAPATLARVALDAATAAAGEDPAERLARLWAEAGGDDEEDAEGAVVAGPFAAPRGLPSFLRRPVAEGPADLATVCSATSPRRLHLS